MAQLVPLLEMMRSDLNCPEFLLTSDEVLETVYRINADIYELLLVRLSFKTTRPSVCAQTYRTLLYNLVSLLLSSLLLMAN